MNLHPIEVYQLEKNAIPLLEMFHPFLRKYYELIRHQKMQWKNYDLRQFIKCYLPLKQQKEEMKRSRFLSNQTKAYTQEILKSINELFDDYLGPMEKDEVYQELVCCLLELAKRYRKKDSSFEMYVYHSFRYQIKRRLDQLSMQVRYEVRFWEEYSDAYQPAVMEEEMEYEQFIEGESVNAPFRGLRMIERMILYFKYILAKSDVEISRISGYHANYIGALRRKLVQRIQSIQGV